MLLALAIGCDDPDLFVGMILDQKKSPYAAVLVAGLEDQARSDSDGIFRVKVPVGQPVVFEVQGTTYKRVRTPADVGTVELVLPQRRHTKVYCPPEPCPLKLDWHLAEGFDAVFRGECTRGASLAVDAPLGLPAVRCGEVDVEVLDRPDGLWVVTPGRPARVRVRAADGALPEDCTVWIGQVPAEVDGLGAWKGTAHGDVVISAACEGRTALPVSVPAERSAEDVLVTWSRTGPRVDLKERAPWARELLLTSEDATPLLVRSEDGLFELPPLTPGTWSVQITGASAKKGETVMIPPAVPGTLVLLPAGTERLIGTLRLDAPLSDGTVPLR